MKGCRFIFVSNTLPHFLLSYSNLTAACFVFREVIWGRETPDLPLMSWAGSLNPDVSSISAVPPTSSHLSSPPSSFIKSRKKKLCVNECSAALWSSKLSPALANWLPWKLGGCQRGQSSSIAPGFCTDIHTDTHSVSDGVCLSVLL